MSLPASRLVSVATDKTVCAKLYADAASLKQLGGLGGYSTERVAVDLDVNLDARLDSEPRARLDAMLAAIHYTAKKVATAAGRH